MIWKFAFRELRHRPGRSVLTLFSIAIGVAAVVAVTTTAETTDRSFAAMHESLTGRAALEVSAAGAGLMDESVADLVAEVPGVKTAAPLIQQPTILYFQSHRVKILSLGIDPERDKDVHHFVVTKGQSMEEANGMLLESTLANPIGAKPGDTIKLLARRGITRARLIGLYQAQGPIATEGGAALLMTVPAAQFLSKMRGSIHTVQVVLESDADEETVRVEIAKRLPEGLQVQPPAARSSFADETALSIRQGMQTSKSFLLLVATLLIANTYLINVSQRRRQFGILRTIGASKRQVAFMLGSEAILMGLIGAICGWLVGVVGATYLTQAMGSLYETTLPSIHVTPISFASAIAYGVGISLLGVLIPARHASELQPGEAMQDVVNTELETGSHKLIWIGLAMVAISSLVLTASIRGHLPPDVSAWAGVFILMGIVFLLRPVVNPISGWIAAALRFVLPVETRFARLQLLRHRTRTALTIGVLFVAMSTGVGLASSVTDNVDNVKTWYRRTMVADFFVRAMAPDMASGEAADIPDLVGNELREIPHINALETVRFIRVDAADRSAIVIAHDFSSGKELLFDLTQGTQKGLRERLNSGDIVIGSVLAERAGGLRPGDRIPLETNMGTLSVRIAAVANDYIAGGQTIYMKRGSAEKMFGISGVDAYLVHADHAHLAEVREALVGVTNKHGLLLQSFSDIQQQIDRMMGGVVAGLWALVVIGFVVAALGVANTLTMNVMEQTRELGLLRIVGTTRRQIRVIILVQALMMAILSMVPGVAAGLLIAYLMNLATYPVSGHVVAFAMHPSLFIGIPLVGIGVILLAAWFPAQRAARLPLLDSIRFQ